MKNNNSKHVSTILTVVPYLQPIVDSLSGQIVGAEILSRTGTSSGFTLTENQLRQIEDTSRANYYTIQLLSQVADYFSQYKNEIPKGFYFSLNLLSFQLLSSELRAAITQFLAVFDGAVILQIEILERNVEDIDDNILDVIDYYDAIGVRFAIDDFGTSASSLKYFGLSHISTVKLDRSVTVTFNNELFYSVLINAVVLIGKACNMTLIAEGVETPEQERLLQDAGIKYTQGFLYSKPVNLSDFRSFLFIHQKTQSYNTSIKN